MMKSLSTGIIASASVSVGDERNQYNGSIDGNVNKLFSL
jgi:hypothetical protein